MNYFRQLKTVTIWEYKRFFKLKNEIIGIFLMLLLFSGGFFGGKFALQSAGKKQNVALVSDSSERLREILSQTYQVEVFSMAELQNLVNQLDTNREKIILVSGDEEFDLFAYKKPPRVERIQNLVTEYRMEKAMQKIGIDPAEYEYVTQSAVINSHFVYQPAKGKRPVVAFIFAGLMVMAVFVSFAYQFTAITGEKQLKVTEQIVSAIKPQVWMDGKILGITLTGMSSLVIYTIISILGGMLFFQFTGSSVTQIIEFIDIPSLGLFLLFTLFGILMWNAVMAAIASVITDPNNSGKSPLMMLPLLFVIASALVLADPDSSLAIFLSWFPLTSASGMPIRWVATELAWWELAGSLAILVISFYLMRKIAAKIFRVSVLISGKEPTWYEVFKMIREN